MWNLNFANFSFHKGSAFAKCSICTSLKAQLEAERRTEEHARLEAVREKHLKHQESRRATYYANRVLANSKPEQYLCIIHDKMDQQKTGIPRMQTKLKSMMTNCIPLPLALTGMLTHGREPGCYGHFSVTGLWPGDPDFTISSLAKCFRDLENYNGDKSGDLDATSINPRQPLFKVLMDQEAFVKGYLEEKKYSLNRYKGEKESASTTSSPLHSQSSSSFKPLPKHLLLQMDNSGKDNKNYSVMAFCSELVARGVFETIEMSFLMVGHTHEDINAFFSRVSSRIKGKDINTFPTIMAEMWESESIHPIPRLIQEVAAYKDYISPFVLPIIGQSQPIAFRFYMRNNLPLYQVKDALHTPWVPINGRMIWRMEDKKVLLPSSVPKAKAPVTELKRKVEICAFLNNFVKWTSETFKDTTSEGYRKSVPLLKYWNTISEMINNNAMMETFTNDNDSLLDGFWPMTNHGTGYKPEEEHEDLIVEEDALERELRDDLLERDEIFVGVASEKERYRYVPLEDIEEGKFVVIRPTDEFESRIPNAFWIARAKSKVNMVKGSPNYSCFEIEWWRPVHRKSSKATEEERYDNMFSDSKAWEVDPAYTSTDWMTTTSTLYAWQPRGKQLPKRVVVPKTARLAIAETIGREDYQIFEE